MITRKTYNEKLRDLYGYYLRFDEALAEAKEIYSKPKHPRDRRTDEERKRDAINGIAMQWAVADILTELGYTVEKAPRGVYHWDLLVNGIKVDVKSKYDAKWYQQTVWEEAYVTASNEEILYLLVDAINFKFDGEIWFKDMHVSNWPETSGRYAEMHKIKAIL